MTHILWNVGMWQSGGQGRSDILMGGVGSLAPWRAGVAWWKKGSGKWDLTAARDQERETDNRP
jgi:hypothetical protein